MSYLGDINVTGGWVEDKVQLEKKQQILLQVTGCHPSPDVIRKAWRLGALLGTFRFWLVVEFGQVY